MHCGRCWWPCRDDFRSLWQKFWLNDDTRQLPLPGLQGLSRWDTEKVARWLSAAPQEERAWPARHQTRRSLVILRIRECSAGFFVFQPLIRVARVVSSTFLLFSFSVVQWRPHAFFSLAGSGASAPSRAASWRVIGHPGCWPWEEKLAALSCVL